jgi:zinc protease
MRKILSKAAFLLIFVISFTFAYAQPKIVFSSLDETIKNDTSVLTGKFQNGLTYYIKENKKPENRLELRLIVKAGSILEDDDQKGLAHFCEHMCFNGTKNFPKMDLVNFLESTGMRFGAELNAYTSWDETVYFLMLPMDSIEKVNKGFQVLEDWAHNVTFDDGEIDKERGVILEEWRGHRGAEERLQRKQMPVLFHDSKYADRNPIGDTNIILNAPHETLKRFYKDWYRPDLMGVVVVGDFNKYDMLKDVKQHFEGLVNPPNERPRTKFVVPPHKETLVSVESDKELDMTLVEVIITNQKHEKGTFREYRQDIINSLFAGMFNNRLKELTRKSDPPFNFAVGQETPFLANMEVMMLIAATKPDGLIKGYETILTEAQRAFQHGFTKTEFEREKKEALRRMQKALAEKDKTETNAFAGELQRNFIDKEAYPGIEYELEMYKKFLPEITLDELNQYYKTLIHKDNSCILVGVPEKEGVVKPSKEEIIAKFDEINNKKLEAYKDKFVNKPLFTKVVDPGTITNEKKYANIGATEWTLSNGAKVVLKPTDFKNDEIVFRSFSYGGSSLASDKGFISARFASDVMNESGVAGFDQTTLEKMLTGKIVNVRSSISDYDEGLSGSCSPQDLEIALQLVHLSFVEPRKDKEAYQSWMENMKSEIKNGENSPEHAYYDTVAVIMAQHHFRGRPITEEVLKEMNLDSAYAFYKARFSDVSNYTFFFVGKFDMDSIKPMILTYIGGLIPKNHKELWKDVGMKHPKEKITKEVKKGIEAKSLVGIQFTGDFDWTRENRYNINSLIEVLKIKLRESIREDKSGTYGIYAYDRPAKIPQSDYTIGIGFGCNPTRVEELEKGVMDVIKDVKNFEVDKKYLIKVKETQLREREIKLKENSFWLNQLYNYFYFGEDPSLIADYGKLVDNLKADDIMKAAIKYLNENRMIKVVLYPEK